MTQLREKIARAVIAEVSRQTNGRWPDEPDELVGLVDDTLDFTELADAILDLPEIKEALAMCSGIGSEQQPLPASEVLGGYQPNLPPRFDCETCGKPTNGKGYYGPQCQCGVSTDMKPSHRVGTLR